MVLGPTVETVIPRLRPGATIGPRVTATPSQTGQRIAGYIPRLRPGATKQPDVPTAAIRVRSRSNRLCRINGLSGEVLEPIESSTPGCGVSDPVRISAIGGVSFSNPVIVNCDTAASLKTWVEDGAIPAWGRLGGGLAQIQTSGSYQCRTVNNQAGGRVSEHGRGAAVDIAGFRLNNGLSIDVESGWRDDLAGQVLRKMHKGACDEFTNVLGPDSDQYHRDHFHFDTARGRGVCR